MHAYTHIHIHARMYTYTHANTRIAQPAAMLQMGGAAVNSYTCNWLAELNFSCHGFALSYKFQRGADLAFQNPLEEAEE